MNAAASTLRTLLAASAIALAGASLAVHAADSAKPAAGGVFRSPSPSWTQLTPDQKEALAPLAGDWDKFDAPRKKKWLDIAVRYKDLSPEGQQKMHERMPDLARLTPDERKTARENFKRAYALPPDKRRELTQQFQDLPEEKKRELAEIAKKKPAPAPRRPGATHPAAPKPAEPGAPQPAAAAPAGTPPHGAGSGPAPRGL